MTASWTRRSAFRASRTPRSDMARSHSRKGSSARLLASDSPDTPHHGNLCRLSPTIDCFGWFPFAKGFPLPQGRPYSGSCQLPP